jgi:dUTP pyrophosphatase
MDLTAIDVEYDEKRDMYIYHTGLAFESGYHYGILLFPRSSNRNTDAYLCNHVGIADSAIYRGEIMLCFKNRTSLETRAMNEQTRFFITEASCRSFTITNDNSLTFTWPEAAKNAISSSNWILDNPMMFAPYNVGDRVAQMVVIPYPDVRINVVEELSETDRGEGGFGSTGK